MHHRRFTHTLLWSLAAVLTTAGLASAADTPQRDAVKIFNDFCIEHFGAEKEPLVYEKFGKELKILPEGVWMHASDTSAVIGWDTNLPAKSYVEYGKTAEYGQRTPEPERHFYVNVRYLRGLERDTTYHYRLVSVDERGNKVASADKTFTTARPEGAIVIPGDMEGPPYVLKEKGTYLLTADIIADGSAFEIRGDDIILDLNGHTVVYNNKSIEVTGKSFKNWVDKSAFGVLMEKAQNFQLFNGTIRQGAGNDPACGISIGFSPFHGEGAGGHKEFAGVTIEFGADQMIGINYHWSRGSTNIHHCVFVDHGSKVSNRHGGGCRAARLDGKQTGEMHHNLVKRTRQMGLAGADKLYNNEVYVDSFSTNSFALQIAAEGGRGYNNRVFATGFNPYGFGWGKKDWKAYDNFIHMVGQDTSKRWGERWGDVNMLAGMRVTNYSKGGQEREDLEYYGNVIVMEGKEDCEIRAVEFFSDETIKNLNFHDNIVKAIALDDQTVRVACVDAQGHFRKENTLPVFYRNNTFISNRHMVRFGDDYGKGNNHQFINNRFIKVGEDHPMFSTFYFGGGYWNYGHVIRDCTFEGGAEPMDVHWGPIGNQAWYQVEWTLTVKAPAGAEVKIVDAKGDEAFAGKVGDDGTVAVPLVQARLSPPEGHDAKAHKEGRGGTEGAAKDAFTPHTVTVAVDGKTAEAKVTMDKARSLVLSGGKLSEK
jgi:hypothetical protein